MGIRCPFFEPRSLGFYTEGGMGPAFNLDTFDAADICSAVACMRMRSSFIDALLNEDPAPCNNCSASTANTEACAAAVRNIMDNPVITCTDQTNVRENILRQLVVNLLNTCLCTTTINNAQENIGGVSLRYVVCLTRAQKLALGFDPTACVTVGDIIALANDFLEACDEPLPIDGGVLSIVIGAMANDPGITIIQKAVCV
ncbi:hypothetical protein [Ammoniphilus resinae]|uniref:Uncharacterized protein n=1 Tax=Ammoniphilus resinae TaxID=861532 RepID=A0ABS4GX07_9BACL|nr:hypothetical protein [Ammoniphilus resinae]MBP1934801.1 hypothetical protein [Ammoniphilus resinae]